MRQAIEADVGREEEEGPYPSLRHLVGFVEDGPSPAAHASPRPQVILIDTGPIVALLRRPDQHHERCGAALRKLEQPVATVWPVVNEAMLLLADRSDAQAALWQSLEDDAIVLLGLDRDDVPRLRELMWKYRDRPIDFADAAFVRVAEREGLGSVFTVDRRDFEVYRLSGRRRIQIVP